MQRSGCLDRDACRRTAFGKRDDLFLPGHSATSLHDASSMVGHRAISGRSAIGECEAGPLYLGLLLCAVLLFCPIEADDFGAPAALALRPLPSTLGRRPVPQEDRYLAAGPARSGFKPEPATRRSGPCEILWGYSRHLGWGKQEPRSFFRCRARALLRPRIPRENTADRFHRRKDGEDDFAQDPRGHP